MDTKSYFCQGNVARTSLDNSFPFSVSVKICGIILPLPHYVMPIYVPFPFFFFISVINQPVGVMIPEAV